MKFLMTINICTVLKVELYFEGQHEELSLL